MTTGRALGASQGRLEEISLQHNALSQRALDDLAQTVHGMGVSNLTICELSLHSSLSSSVSGRVLIDALARNREAKHRRELPAKKVWSKENITLHAPKSAYAQVYEGEELKRQLERRARILASAVDSHQMHEDAKRADPKWDEHLSARAERDGGEL